VCGGNSDPPHLEYVVMAKGRDERRRMNANLFISLLINKEGT